MNANTNNEQFLSTFSRHYYKKLCIQYLQQLYMITTFRDEEKAQSLKA